MIYSNPLIRHIGAWSAGIFFLFAGCGTEPEPPKPKVFTKRIAGETAAAQVPKPAPSPADATAPAPLPIDTRQQEPQAVLERKIPDAPKGSAKPPATPTPIAETAPPPAVAYEYDPKGKIDPFLPWYESGDAASEAQASKRLFLSPLEKVDLSQLKLVGIILSTKGNEALVEDSTGKGSSSQKAPILA